MEEWRGYLWPGWEIVRKIGSGSYGDVYEIHRRNGSYVEKAALKVISIPRTQAELEALHMEGIRGENTREYLQRHVEEIRREIGLMQQLVGYSNIVSYEDYLIRERTGSVGWDILIRMELLNSLQDQMLQGPVSDREILRIGVDISRALEICHGKRFLHRDIKPQNIFRNKDGFYKLGDFGIARAMPGSESVMSFKGTVSYMAPETFQMRDTDARSDIYSLALVLYRILNGGREPFLPASGFAPEDREKAQWRRLHGEALPAPAGCSASLWHVLSIALSADPEARYQSAAAFNRALKDALCMLAENGQEDRTESILTEGTQTIWNPNDLKERRIPEEKNNSYRQESLEGIASPGRDRDHERHAKRESSGDKPEDFLRNYLDSSNKTADGNLQEEEQEEREGRSRRGKMIGTCLRFAGIILVGLIAGWFYMSSRQADKPGVGVYTEEENDGQAGDSSESETQAAAVDAAVEEAEEEASLNAPVAFEDPVLGKAVREALSVQNGIITRRLAMEQKELELSGAGKNESEKITDITGLSAFENLEKLILRNNEIQDVSELRTLTRLTKLNLEGNRVSDLTPLSGMHTLTSLDLFDNQISDITPITGLTGVRMLDVRKNQIVSIRGIGGMYNIDELYLGRNRITDISPVAELQNLSALGFGYNQVEDISSLKELPLLHLLTMNGNRIRDISPVAGMQELYHLEIAGNPIEDYSPLDSLPKNVKIER